MNYLKKAKNAVKDVQDIQKGMKELGFSFGEKKEHQSAASSTVAPSVAAHSTMTDSISASSTAAPPVLTPASTIATPAGAPAGASPGDLNVPHCTAEDAPTKITLAARKKLRDDFEAKVPALEAEYSRLLETPWKIHVDNLGVYTYMKNNKGTDYTQNPGGVVWDYFDSMVRRLKEYKEKYGADFIRAINEVASTHTITLEPTDDKKVNYSSTDFYQNRWRILFRDTAFASNVYAAGEYLPDILNEAEKTRAISAGGPGAGPGLSLIAKQSISSGWDEKGASVLTKCQEKLAAPTLAFQPNFEANYATLAAYKAGDKKKKLRDDWEMTLGPATTEYFEGFSSQLSWQKFDDDDMMQEGFKEAVDKLIVEFRVTPDVQTSYCDCVLEDGKLIIRAKPDAWWTNVDAACEKLSDLL